MNQLNTSSNKDLADTKPLFASTWIALFTELRKNYNERNPDVSTNAEGLQTVRQNQTEQKSNSI